MAAPPQRTVVEGALFEKLSIGMNGATVSRSIVKIKEGKMDECLATRSAL